LKLLGRMSDARRNTGDRGLSAELRCCGIYTIDVVVVGMYIYRAPSRARAVGGTIGATRNGGYGTHKLRLLFFS